ncbi:MAG: rRNA maturation RNase YbeY [Rikenellaceae bacterium]|nr:rRNA maturation RNase YbeY [Rikenellaceae bacterium]MCL2693280.1 rRNA maturation RNase YbeY [Rikenellaceae bacterium]
MAIKFFNDGSSCRFAGKRAVAAWVARCVAREGYAAGEVSIIFCSQQRHLEINRRYLGHDYATDVITFDYSDLARGMVSGDVFIDPVTVAENAQEYGVSVREEMLRVVAHGVLHLCGYGDATPDEQMTMREKEDEWIAAATDT